MSKAFSAQNGKAMIVSSNFGNLVPTPKRNSQILEKIAQKLVMCAVLTVSPLPTKMDYLVKTGEDKIAIKRICVIFNTHKMS